MQRLFFISAIRNLKKDKFHLFLNITGLALGLAAFLFIVTTIFHELSFDRFNLKSNRIYRCVAFLKMGDVNTNFSKSEIPLAQAAMNDLPEVEEATRLIPRKNIVIYQNDRKFVEAEIWFADANVFKVFDFNLTEGNKETILSDPYSIILTKKAAEKYFGNTNLMVDGRFFSDEIVSERGNAIINEEAARLLGWADCKDKILYDYNDGGNDYNVIGIVKDFHLRSMRDKPAPLVIRITDQEEFLAIRAGAGKINTILETAILNWNKFNSDAPFEYFFLDENFDAQYKKEEQLSKLINLFTLIAISIASLGLFGLVSYTSIQRQKEIGIRKVNGAKVVEIIAMLNKDFVKWVAIAFVIATPIAYYAMNKWLENFAYKTELSWWIFVLAGLLALGIALLTVSWQSWRAATRNPVEALRYE